jgi:hypothetical protein
MNRDIRDKFVVAYFNMLPLKIAGLPASRVTGYHSRRNLLCEFSGLYSGAIEVFVEG